MRKLYPRRYDLGDATFSRSSSAYGSDDKLATTNIPRIDRTKFGKMVWVEEGTTNLVPVANQKFVGWYTEGYATIKLTQNQVVHEWHCIDATRIQTSGGTYTVKYYLPIAMPSLAGQVYTESIYIKNIGSNPVIVATNLGQAQTINVGESKLVKLTATGNGVSDVQINFQARNISDALDFIAWHPMAEAKAYATSFIETSRAAESLTMPTAGLSPSEGTIEGIVEITDVVKRNADYGWIFQLARSGSGDMRFFHGDDGNFHLQIRNDSNVMILDVTISDDALRNSLYYYKLYWLESNFKIEFWDVLTRDKTVEKIFVATDTPSSFVICRIGGAGSTSFANTRFGRHRLSNIARTTDPDFNNLMPRDEYTVALFDPTYTFLR